MVKKIIFMKIILIVLLFISCAQRSPVERLQSQLNQFPEYTIILQDMNEEGLFFKDYYHRYKIVFAQKVEGYPDSLLYYTDVTDWINVDKNEYEQNANYLGMVLASKGGESGISNVPSPPGYQYVGNERYGRWRQDSHGNSFWEFYGRFAFFSHVFGGFTRPLYRSDWDDYRGYRNMGRPYYGRNNQYGTHGTLTKQTNRSFFQRQRAKAQARKSGFMNKFKQRTSRSRMSGFRSRSGGFGK
jgi:hypothetical protein